LKAPRGAAAANSGLVTGRVAVTLRTASEGANGREACLSANEAMASPRQRTLS